MFVILTKIKYDYAYNNISYSGYPGQDNLEDVVIFVYMQDASLIGK